ncbi:uncharacterized protein N7446_005581 [Penicillium canescens]|uniref:Uncharacterized protein n=1 Tax=Penicillium canescens TaxID=5083 RepID=A0AAD6NBW5_PENCN|nr:uncharacterized protein N7446_005581 [Penicillium canescens]KAJ6050181.1 hypothetical protein N7444_006897 [Penicillium canescens]KAJ6050953.1 hypothetical protein N7460_001487 [Penicillium canescens]KAJ6061461.1 hypothetical protein N7446_005581 [Penicillium canescens]
MDSPDCEPNARTRHSQNTVCPPHEHEDGFSIHPSNELAEKLLWAEDILAQEPHPKAHDDPCEPLPVGLKGLEQVHPDLPQPSTQILGLYSTLWDCYSAKKAHSQRLETENKALRATNIHLSQEKEILKHRYANQEALLVYFEQAFENLRLGILGICKDWEGCSPGPVFEHGSAQAIGDS